MIECIFNIFEGLGALVAGKVGLDVGFFIHKKGGEDLVHVDSGDVVVVLFVDKVDEVHGFVVEAEETDPLFEVEVFVFDFFDDGRKQILHLFLQHEHFWDLRVGVLADDVLQLGPLHFLALVVEQCAFALCGEALFTDEGGFSAVGVDADHVALVSVDTVGAVLDWTAHKSQKIIEINLKCGHK